MKRVDVGAAWACVILLLPSWAAAAQPPEAPRTEVSPPASAASAAPATAKPAPMTDLGEGPSKPPVEEQVDVAPAAPSPAPASIVPVLSTEKRRRFNLIIAGVSTLLAAYTADRLLARDLSQSGASWVPLMGPWWILSEESSRPNPSPALQALLVIDGLVQLSGLALTITGTFLRYDRVVLRLPSAPSASPVPSTVTP